MDFLTAKIDRAIVVTECELFRGFFHPLGHREMPMSSARSLETITANFMIFAADSYGDRKSTDEHYADYFESSYEDYLAMCKRLASECDFSQEEAIQIIVLEIVRQSEEMKAEVVAGKRQDSPFLKPLEKDNCWGKAVIALAEAFEVKLEQLAA